MLTLDRLIDIIAQGEEIDAEYMTGQRNMAFYGLPEYEIAVEEGME